MAAPEFVPTSPTARRSYVSPGRRPGSWMADRPGELGGPQPRGERLGDPGPDQGYVVHLTDVVKDQLRLSDGEHSVDALAAVGAVALKRASLFGRAPVIHDVTAALSLLGLAEPPPTGAAADRRRLALEEAHHPHAYEKLREIVDRVPADALDRPLDAIRADGAIVTW